MPQIDKITYFNQLFWLFLSFSFYYCVLLKVFLPKISSVLKARKKYGFKTIGGLELFIYQGIESFLIFTKRNELREKLMNSSKHFISKYQNLYK